MTIDQIYQNGKHYDQLFQPGNPLPQFWVDRAAEYGGPVLELACGTGRVSIPLAQQGLQVTGIDQAESMLGEARRKAAAAGVAVEWINADMRHFDLGKTFSLILLPNNALCHLLDLADFERCMACVKRHLRPHGRFIVEVFAPSLELLLHRPDERHHFATYDDPDGTGEIVVTSTSMYDAATQIKHTTTYYKFSDRAQEEAGALPMRMYFPQELDALWKYNGFVIEHKFGGQDLSAFDARSSMQLYVLSQMDH